MTKIGLYEAKTRLSELIDRVERGERITITRHGVSVALLEPIDSMRRMQVADAIRDLKAFRRKHHLKGLSLRKMIAEGRR